MDVNKVDIYLGGMRLTFYQQLYETEWQRRDHVQSAVSTPLSVVVLVGTALAVLAQEFEARHPFLATTFWAAFTVAAVTFGIAVYMLVRSFYGYLYQRIPLPSQLLAYHEGLQAHYTALGTPGLADQEFDLYLRQRYVDAGDRNAVNNVNRGEYLHQGNRALILSLCALVCCAVPHVISKRLSDPEPQKIELVTVGER